MKKFLFVLVSLVMSMSCFAQQTYEVNIKYFYCYYRCELTQSGKIETRAGSVPITTRKLNFFSIDNDGYGWAHSDSILIKLLLDKKTQKLIKKNKIGNLQKTNLIGFNTIKNSIETKIHNLWQCGEENKEKEQAAKAKQEAADTIFKYNEIKKVVEDSLKYYVSLRDNELSPVDNLISKYEANNTQILRYNSNDILIAYNGMDIDCVGGCSPRFKIYNCSKKTIKYINLNIKFYNRVDDPVYDNITRQCMSKYNIVGPIEYLGNTDCWSWDSKFYNTTADYFVITSINIQYMDKTSITLTKKQLESREIEYSYSDYDLTYGKYDDEITKLNNQRTDILKKYENKINQLQNMLNNADKKILTAENKIYSNVAHMPKYPGGDAALMKHINKNIMYPKTAADNNIQGKVIVQFVVEKDGRVGEVKVARGVDSELDAEAIRAVKTLSKFTPGQNAIGEPIRTWYTIPVTFKLQEGIK